ncbi:MAG: histidine--tRNA ligase [Pseudomonadota bacterium]
MTDDASPEPIRPEARSPRGFGDRRGRDLIAERRLIERVSAVYERWGFEPLETPAFEYVDALGKFLPDTDRPNEGVLALQDDDDQWIALRYDHTAPLARYAAQTWETLPKPFRRYAYGPVWRNEKPGPGRFREFVQCDADTVGSDRPEADAEIIAMAGEGLRAAGLEAGQAVVRVSNRKLFDGLFETSGVMDTGQRLTALRAVDKFDRLGWQGVRDLLGEGRLDDSGDYTKGAQLPAGAIKAIGQFLMFHQADASRSATIDTLADSGLLGAVGGQALAELSAIDRALSAMKVGEDAVKFDPTIVRGLEYYTGAVFEAELLLDTVDDKGRAVRFGSIGGGGRYDDLVARFTGQSVPATGFSFGVSRLASALKAAGRGDRDVTRGPVVVIVFSDDDMGAYLDAVAELRNAGVPTELYLGRAGMKAQMKYADRRGAPAAVILGGDEIAAGTVTIKDLDAGRALAAATADNAAWKSERPGQVVVPRADLVATVRSIIDTSSRI